MLCYAKSLQSCSTLCDPMDCSCQAFLSRQEYWNGLPCPLPGDLPNLGVKPMSPALQVDSLLLSHWENPGMLYCSHIYHVVLEIMLLLLKEPMTVS